MIERRLQLARQREERQKLSYRGQKLNLKPGEEYCETVQRDTVAQNGATSDLEQRGSADVNQGNWAWKQ